MTGVRKVLRFSNTIRHEGAERIGRDENKRERQRDFE